MRNAGLRILPATYTSHMCTFRQAAADMSQGFLCLCYNARRNCERQLLINDSHCFAQGVNYVLSHWQSRIFGDKNCWKHCKPQVLSYVVCQLQICACYFFIYRVYHAIGLYMLQFKYTTRALRHRPECILCKIGQEKGQ